MLVGAGAVTACSPHHRLRPGRCAGESGSLHRLASAPAPDDGVTLVEAVAAPVASTRGDQPHPAKLKVVLTRTERQVLELGDEGVSFGSLSFSEGEIRAQRRG